MAVKKRCRTIGGVVYDLEATDRKPPCGRARAAKPAPAPRKSAPPAPRKSAPPAAAVPAIRSLMLTVEPGPVGGYDLIASSRDGGGVAEVIGHYGDRDSAKRARAGVEKTGDLPKPEPKPFRKRDVRVTDHRVLERQEREREHVAREHREAFARASSPKSTLDKTGVLPKRAPRSHLLENHADDLAAAARGQRDMKVSERRALADVRKRNAAGVLYTADAFKPATREILIKLARSGHVVQHGASGFFVPEFAERFATKPLGDRDAPRPSRYDLGKRKPVPLPKSVDPALVRVGDRVSVFSYGDSEPQHATVRELPGTAGRHEPVVYFESGANEGMNRSIKWERVFFGWLSTDVNWVPWRG